MNTWPSIHREGALALSPHDVAKGNKELDDLIDSAARSIAKREALLVASYGLSGAGFITSCLTYLFFTFQKPPWVLASNLALGAGALSVTIVALTWLGWAAIQQGRFAKPLGNLSGVSIPPPLQELIDSFASGVRDARTASGNTVLPRLFASRWAIMLFSHDPRHRQLVRCSRGTKQKEEIFARPTQPDLGQPADATNAPDAPEQPLRNSDPAMAWLVGGTIQHFTAGLDGFLDLLPPHQVDAYRQILTVARRELRKGGQSGAQEEAIRIIRDELAERGLLICGTSRATIMKLLHGQHGSTDITRYFHRPYGRLLPARRTDQDSFG